MVNSIVGGDGDKGLTAKESNQLRGSKNKAQEGGAAEKIGGRRTVSYKDICVGVNGSGVVDADEDEALHDCFGSPSEGSAYWSDEEGGSEAPVTKEPNPLCPVIHITAAERKEACKKWEKAVIVKLLGKRIGLRRMQARLSRLWQSSGEMEVIDLAHDFFVVRFTNREDYERSFRWGTIGDYGSLPGSAEVAA